MTIKKEVDLIFFTGDPETYNKFNKKFHVYYSK